MLYTLNNTAPRYLNHMKTGARPIGWSHLVWLYRNGKLTAEKAELVRLRLANSVKAAAKGFKQDDHKAHQEATGEQVYAPKSKAKAKRVDRELDERELAAKQLQANEAKLAELQRQLEMLKGIQS